MTDGPEAPLLADPRARVDALNEYTIHPVADMWPLMGEADLQEMAADIAQHGLREPIWRSNGVIIDGRNRLVACKMAGVAPKFQEWRTNVPGDTVEAFILTKNLYRRHLSASARAAIAVQVEEQMVLEREKRRRLQEQMAKNVEVATSTPQPPAVPLTEEEREEVAKNSPLFGVGTDVLESGRIRDHASKLTGVSTGYIHEAKRIKDADEATFTRVRDGELSIQQAQDSLVETAMAEGTLEQLTLSDRTKKAAGERIEKRQKKSQIKKFTKVQSSKVEVTITAVFGNEDKANAWLDQMRLEPSVLRMSSSLEPTD